LRIERTSSVLERRSAPCRTAGSWKRCDARSARRVRAKYRVPLFSMLRSQPASAVAEWQNGKLRCGPATQNSARCAQHQTDGSFHLAQDKVVSSCPDTGVRFGGKHTEKWRSRVLAGARRGYALCRCDGTRDEELLGAYFRPPDCSKAKGS